MNRRWVEMSTLSGKKTLNRNVLKYEPSNVRNCGL